MGVPRRTLPRDSAYGGALNTRGHIATWHGVSQGRGAGTGAQKSHGHCPSNKATPGLSRPERERGRLLGRLET